MKLLAILSLCFMSCILSSSANKKPSIPWCSSCNDPHLRSTDGLAYEFQYSGTYIMYTNYGDKRVTASFQRCHPNKVRPTCNCGFHIQFKGSLFLLDTCGSIPKGALQFYSAVDSTSAPTVAACSTKTVPAGKETDDTWWNGAGNALKVIDKFLCAKSANQQDTFIIRTNDADNNKNIYVKVHLHCRGITCLYVRAAADDFDKTGGLCGNYNRNKTDDLFIWKQTGQPDGSINGGYTKVPSDPLEMSTFWILERCAPDELKYKTLDICLCDKTDEGPNNECATKLSVCAASACGHPFVPKEVECVHSHDAKPSDSESSNKLIEFLFELFKINAACKENLITQEELELFKIYCLLDHMETSSIYWLLETCQIARNTALDNCGESNNGLCNEFRTHPTRCILPGYRSILGDDGNVGSCPKKVDNCPNVCPLPL